MFADYCKFKWMPWDSEAIRWKVENDANYGLFVKAVQILEEGYADPNYEV